ncbi:MAG: SH3 domain-containing protein [Puniceicoccales bacterium]|jgi:hypothetical protein|nr:SH3 domain-containing protein [Puniceicoccales bacterium]
MKILLSYFFLFFLSPLGANSTDTVPPRDSIFFAANEAYSNQNYNRVITLLESMGTHSFARYFNLGCAYKEIGDTSRAWVAFEKAKQIRPYDKNLRHILQTLPLSSKQRHFIPFYQTSFAMNIFTLIAGITFWLSVGLAIYRRMKKLNSRKKPMLHFIFHCSSMLCLTSTGILLYASHSIFRKCVTVADNTTVHIAPTSQSEVIQNFPPGTPLLVPTKYGNFLHINLENGQNGWIDCKNVKYILD